MVEPVDEEPSAARRRSVNIPLETSMASSTEAVSTPAIADHPVRAALLLGALGVVFGDIGTSPIYAFREALKAAGGPSEAAVFGFSRSFSGRSS
jgi:K+ potassium transporter